MINTALTAEKQISDKIRDLYPTLRYFLSALFFWTFIAWASSQAVLGLSPNLIEQKCTDNAVSFIKDIFAVSGRFFPSYNLFSLTILVAVLMVGSILVLYKLQPHMILWVSPAALFFIFGPVYAILLSRSLLLVPFLIQCCLFSEDPQNCGAYIHDPNAFIMLCIIMALMVLVVLPMSWINGIVENPNDHNNQLHQKRKPHENSVSEVETTPSSPSSSSSSSSGSTETSNQ
jgi:hypothetical protein